MKQKKPITIRVVSQILFLLFSASFLSLIILGYRQAIHAICPYAVVCFGLGKSGWFSLTAVLFWITSAVSVLVLIHSMFVGRVFCGFICPIGTIQEAVFSWRTLKFRKKQQVPFFYEKRFASFKYFVLLITSILSILGIGYVFIRFCPMFGLSLLPKLAIPGLVVFILIVIMGMFRERFWCRYLCPYAALLNAFQAMGNLAGIKRRMIHRNLERCIDCGICEQYCPMNLNITEEEFERSYDCIHCNICAEKCPKPSTICCEKDV